MYTGLININHLSLRKIIGLLGILLPPVLALCSGFDIPNSISDYYYTKQSIIFIWFLTAFGFSLIVYRGYEKENELLSDNALTNIAGILALLTILIPSANAERCNLMPNGHCNIILHLLHVLCAGGFLTIMGWMAFFRFTKGNKADKRKLKRNRFYRICGIGVWLSVAGMGIVITFNSLRFACDVFIGETIALFFYGSAWLIKGKTFIRFGL